MKIKTLMSFFQIICIVFLLASGAKSDSAAPPGTVCQVGGGRCPSAFDCLNYCKFFGHRGGICDPAGGNRCCCIKK
ncbi:hypothetical protein VNO80_17122 [Phaseolus coccineus]|uniref:Uncharacterized protein n=1 Tax=Phaseolus coccineus TaxID=3886 RepID=A0AAN9MN00_PHACN